MEVVFLENCCTVVLVIGRGSVNGTDLAGTDCSCCSVDKVEDTWVLAACTATTVTVDRLSSMPTALQSR